MSRRRLRNSGRMRWRRIERRMRRRRPRPGRTIPSGSPAGRPTTSDRRARRPCGGAAAPRARTSGRTASAWRWCSHSSPRHRWRERLRIEVEEIHVGLPALRPAPRRLVTRSRSSPRADGRGRRASSQRRQTAFDVAQEPGPFLGGAAVDAIQGDPRRAPATRQEHAQRTEQARHPVGHQPDVAPRRPVRRDADDAPDVAELRPDLLRPQRENATPGTRTRRANP